MKLVWNKKKTEFVVANKVVKVRYQTRSLDSPVHFVEILTSKNNLIAGDVMLSMVNSKGEALEELKRISEELEEA